MITPKVVRYTTHPEHADENQRLIGEVFAEFADTQPAGLRYMSLRLADGVSFVHIAFVDAAENPLQSSRAFAQFQAGLPQRCATPPVALDATVAGSYGWGRADTE